MPDFRLAYRPFAEQQAYFRRKVNVPTARWDDLARGDHAHGFMVAGVAREAVLNDIRTAVEDAISKGETLADFRKRFDAIIDKNGWPGGAGNESDKRRAWRTRIIYQTNLRTSYMAGRWEQLKQFPYLRYQHNTVTNPREQHQGWDGMIFDAQDPWWDTHYPPNGWGCRCTVTGVSQARLQALRGKGAKPDPAPPPGDGDPPPEWAYHVGKAARSLPVAQQFGSRVAALPPPWRDIALGDAQVRAADWHAELAPAIDSMLAQRARPQGRTIGAGMLQPSVFRYLEGRGEPPSTALIAVSDADLAHLARDSKALSGRGLPEQFLVELVDRLARPDATFFDTLDPAIIYAWTLADGSVAKVVMRIDYRRKGELERLPANWIRSGGIVQRADLAGQRYELIGGGL